MKYILLFALVGCDMNSDCLSIHMDAKSTGEKICYSVPSPEEAAGKFCTWYNGELIKVVE